MTPGQFKRFTDTAIQLLETLSTGKTTSQTDIKGRVLSSLTNSSWPALDVPHDSNVSSYQVDVLWGNMKTNIMISGQYADRKATDFALGLKSLNIPFCQTGTNFTIP